MEHYFTHTWVQLLGYRFVTVNGKVKSIAAVCSSCLCQSTDVAADEPCDHLVERYK